MEADPEKVGLFSFQGVSVMRRIAIYGKGGIGKTTVAANLSVLFARSGSRVLHVGCDPKRDSTYTLANQWPVPTVLHYRHQGHRDDGFVFLCRHGITGVEAGGPDPGVGCAGRGLTLAFEALKETGHFDENRYDIILFDVLGDVVCGGFATPIHGRHASEIYLVVSGELMSLYAANNLARAVARYAERGVRLAGIIPNLRSGIGTLADVEHFAARIKTRILPMVARDELFYKAEEARTTLSDLAPDSNGAQSLRAVYEAVRDTDLASLIPPTPMNDAEFDTFVRRQ